MVDKTFDFTTGSADDDALEAQRLPKPFTIRYKHRTATEDGVVTWESLEEKFTTKGRIPTGVLMESMAGMAGSEASASRAVLRLLNAALVPEDTVRFDEFLYDADNLVDLADIGKVVDWLIEEYSERPTRSA